jgi:iron(III) transport system permease protein
LFSWKNSLLLIGLLLALPVIVIFASFFYPQVELWRHLADTVLADYVINSLILATGVGAICLALGTGLAWIIVRYDFYGRSVMQWLVLLPMAMPAYIIAYSYTGMLDFAGPLQTAIRSQFGWSYGDYWFPEIRSLSGAILMMSLVLYPYVYMLARTAFSDQAHSLREASKSLGVSPRRFFFRVSFPLARPAILTGTALAMMEAFADYGTVSYFGVNTFTTGIFRTWFGLGNGIAAAQLAALLCSFVLLLLLLEKCSRRHTRYYYQGQKGQSQPPISVSPGSSILLFSLCGLAPLLGFFIPIFQLLEWSILTWADNANWEFLTLVANSFILASISALVIVTIALLFAYAKRKTASWLLTIQVQVASLGYAIPGTVIAIGVLLPLSWADTQINELSLWFVGSSPGLILSGTIFAVILAYAVRFMSVALHNVESGLARITPNMDNAAQSLGLSSNQTFLKVHLPLLRASVLSAVLLVFVDVLKELPATLILRPFNFNTLAVRSYEMASDERLSDAAFPALAIVLVGLLPVILLTKALDKGLRNEN